MNDVQLLTFGSTVSFIALAGAYVFLRERWLQSHQARKAKAESRRRRTERAQELA